MGKLLSALGTKNRTTKLTTWKNGNWEFSIRDVEEKRQLLARKRKVEIKLDKEIIKRQKLEKEVVVLTTTNKHQADIIRAKKSYSSTKNGMNAADSSNITEKGSWEIP